MILIFHYPIIFDILDILDIDISCYPNSLHSFFQKNPKKNPAHGESKVCDGKLL